MAPVTPGPVPNGSCRGQNILTVAKKISQLYDRVGSVLRQTCQSVLVVGGPAPILGPWRSLFQPLHEHSRHCCKVCRQGAPANLVSREPRLKADKEIPAGVCGMAGRGAWKIWRAIQSRGVAERIRSGPED